MSDKFLFSSRKEVNCWDYERKYDYINYLRKLDEKALTSEGKIKSYKINYNKIKRNPMGGISIEIIINDNDSLRLGTIINKYNKDVGYEFGSLSLSPGLSKLIRGE